MTDPQAPKGRRPHDIWSTFVSWHRDPDFYRDIYANTVAAILFAFIVYAVAALAGFVTKKPLLVMVAAAFLVCAIWLLIVIAMVRPIWRHVRPLFRVWETDGSAEGLRAQQLYTPLIFSGYGTAVSGVFLIALLASARTWR